jgi:hypothetical protein
VDVIAGDKTIEVRPYECNYTIALKKILSSSLNNPNNIEDFVLYCGPMVNIDFSAFPWVFTCDVGSKNQKYYLNDQEEMVALLEKLVELTRTPQLPPTPLTPSTSFHSNNNNHHRSSSRTNG